MADTLHGPFTRNRVFAGQWASRGISSRKPSRPFTFFSKPQVRPFTVSSRTFTQGGFTLRHPLQGLARERVNGATREPTPNNKESSKQ